MPNKRIIAFMLALSLLLCATLVSAEPARGGGFFQGIFNNGLSPTAAPGPMLDVNGNPLPSVVTGPTVQPAVTAAPTVKPAVTAAPTVKPAVTAAPTVKPAVTANPAPSGGEMAKRTVMVYMVGSDLEADAQCASRDMREIAASGVDLSRVNVVFGLGGSQSWREVDLVDGQMQIFKLISTTGADRYMPLDTATRRDMAKSSVLTYFIKTAMEACPAERYDLLLWNHGGGPLGGYGHDAISDHMMSIFDLAYALEDAGLENNKLEMVCFDVCLMGSVEVAAVMAPYAEYMIASEENVPGSGLDYAFMGQPSMYADDTEALAREICDLYKKSMSKNRDYTMSVLRLGQISAVGAAMDNLFYQNNAFSVPADLPMISFYINSTKGVGRWTSSSAYDLFDMRDFCQKIREKLPSSAEQLLRAIDGCVAYHVSNVSNTGGLSFYHPLEGNQNAKRYLTMYRSLAKRGFAPGYAAYLEQQMNYKTGASGAKLGLASTTPNSTQLITAASGRRTTTSSAPESAGESGAFALYAAPPVAVASPVAAEEPEATEAPVAADEPAPVYTLQLTPEQHADYVRGLYMILAAMEDDPDTYRLVELSRDVQLSPSGLLSAQRELNTFKLYCAENQEWADVVLIEREHTEDSARYWTEFLLMRDLDIYTVDAMVLRNAENPDGVVLELVPETDEETMMAPKQLMEVEPGDLLESVIPVRRLTRSEDGRIQSFTDWPDAEDDVISFYEFMVGEDGLQTAFSPGDENTRYYIQLVMVGQSGETVASELMPMER